MKKRQSRLHEVKIKANELNFEQPLGRFLITLFRMFEDELIVELYDLKHKNITATDFNVLRFIEPKGIQSVEVAKLAGVSKQAISRQIQSLEERGYVQKDRDPLDSRAQLVMFTKKGTKLIEDAISIIEKIELRYTKILGKNEFITLKENINKLILSYN